MKMKDYFLHCSDWSFSFTIPSFKSVKYKSVNIKYGSLTQDQQYNFLEDHLQDISNFGQNIKWVYEEHKENDNRLHVHGFITNAVYEEVEQFRTNFYASYKINCSMKSYLKFSNIQQTIKHIGYFENYCKKHQHEIKYFMRVVTDLKHIENLDKGINTAKDIKIYTREEFESWPPEQKYLFGKHNNFIVDF